MRRPSEQLCGRTAFHDPTEVHHLGAFAQVPHHAEIVRDEDQRQAEAITEIRHQLEHRRLHRDVERRDRLVGDEHRRLERQGAGDPDTLALATRELPGVGVEEARWQPNGVEELRSAGLDRGARHESVHSQQLPKDRTDGESRVQREHRILEDHLHRPVLGAAPARSDGRAGEHQPAAGRALQPDQRPRERGLPAPRLTDDRNALAGLDDEVDAVHGGQRSTTTLDSHRVLDAEVLDDQDRPAHVVLTPCSCRSQQATSCPSDTSMVAGTRSHDS